MYNRTAGISPAGAAAELRCAFLSAVSLTNVYNNVYTAFSYFVILENFLLSQDIEGLEPTSPAHSAGILST